MTKRLAGRVLDLAVAIQQIPAPPFAEAQRAAFVRDRFREEALEDIEMDGLGNVYARLPGEGSSPALVLSAHSDSVFPANTDLCITRSAGRICGPGIGDNALGLAGLFGAVWGLRRKGARLPGDLWLVANVGEEGVGDLRGMRAVVERFGERAGAYIILEGMALGQVYHRSLGVRRYRIGVRTPGGHSWVDYGQPSAIHELAVLINRLLELPLPSQPRATLNVGVIAGGLSVNSIAGEAHLEVDLRSESVDALAGLAARVEAAAQAAARPHVEVSVEVIGQRPVGEISADHPLVRLSARSLEAVGIRPCLNVGSTDANVPLSCGFPAICLGLTTGSGAHTLAEAIDVEPLARGLAHVLAVIEGAYRLARP